MTESGNPWKVLSEKLVYENRWLNLTEYDVINPGGGKGIYGKIHFKNMAIGIIPLDDELNTYLVGQFRFALNAYSWEIPEGGGDPSENPLETAKRELKEETGLSAREWVPIMEIHLSNSVSDEKGIIFLARNLDQGKSDPEETEKLVVKKLPFEEAYQMVEAGQITDSISIAAIQKVKLMLLNNHLRKHEAANS